MAAACCGFGHARKPYLCESRSNCVAQTKGSAPPWQLGVVHELCGYEFTNPGSGVILGRVLCCEGTFSAGFPLRSGAQRGGSARARCRVFIGA